MPVKLIVGQSRMRVRVRVRVCMCVRFSFHEPPQSQLQIFARKVHRGCRSGICAVQLCLSNSTVCLALAHCSIFGFDRSLGFHGVDFSLHPPFHP